MFLNEDFGEVKIIDLDRIVTFDVFKLGSSRINSFYSCNRIVTFDVFKLLSLLFFEFILHNRIVTFDVFKCLCNLL